VIRTTEAENSVVEIAESKIVWVDVTLTLFPTTEDIFVFGKSIFPSRG